MFDQDFDYYAIILKGPFFFHGHGVFHLHQLVCFCNCVLHVMLFQFASYCLLQLANNRCYVFFVTFAS